MPREGQGLAPETPGFLATWRHLRRPQDTWPSMRSATKISAYRAFYRAAQIEQVARIAWKDVVRGFHLTLIGRPARDAVLASWTMSFTRTSEFRYRYARARVRARLIA